MALLKCKICGGSLNTNEKDVFAVCEYCGSKQTLPKSMDERAIDVFNRINQLRQQNEYDKALKLCEQSISSDSNDSESYWNMVLCKYGVEYVVDPKTNKHIPTINRLQNGSILKDADYLKTLEYASPEEKEIYHQQALEIDSIQKNILDISKKEKPYDVFICYKETDETGKRTQDSIIAEELYNQLTGEGLKVFFARITLEEKLGSEYEPYIFSALNSAKVMVVLGTKEQNFNAVWVKNEWSRFLGLCRDDSSKKIIPAYKDMDAYDLPGEFAHLQALDMSKLGFMSDLTSNIREAIRSSKKKSSKSLNTILKILIPSFAVLIALLIALIIFINFKNDTTNTDSNGSSGGTSSNEELNDMPASKTFNDVLKELNLTDKYTFDNDIFRAGGTSEDSQNYEATDTSVNIKPYIQQLNSSQELDNLLSGYAEIDISKAEVISSDPSIAAVENGVVLAKSYGKTIIYAVYEGKIDCFEITVISIETPKKFIKEYGDKWAEGCIGEANVVIGSYDKITCEFNDELTGGIRFSLNYSGESSYAGVLRNTGYFKLCDPDGTPIKFFTFSLPEGDNPEVCELGYILSEEITKSGVYTLEHVEYK